MTVEPPAAGPGRLRVALDARPLSGSGNGISRVLVQLLHELAARPDLALTLLSNRPLRASNLPPDVDQVIDARWARLPGSVWYLNRFLPMAREAGADVVWGTQAVLPRRGRRPIPSVLTVHDMVVRRHPGTMQPVARLVLGWATGRSLRQADRVVATSDFTLGEIRRLVAGLDPGKFQVVHPGRTDLGAPVAPAAPLPDDFLFCLGSLEPRKNLLRLVEVHARLLARHPRLHLVLAGAHRWQAGALMQAIEASPGADRIRLLDGLSDAQVQHCMVRSQGLVMPSLYEGFGMPLVEAAGVAPRLFANDIPVFREVGRGLHGLAYVRFDDPALAADQLDEGLRRAPACGPPPGHSLQFRRWRDAAADYASAFRLAAGG